MNTSVKFAIIATVHNIAIIAIAAILFYKTGNYWVWLLLLLLLKGIHEDNV